MRANHPLPDAIANAPSLLPGLELYYGAFMELHSDRPYHMGGAGPIPWSSIMRYAEFAGLTDEDDIYLLHVYIRAMDEFYLNDQAKKAKNDGI